MTTLNDQWAIPADETRGVTAAAEKPTAQMVEVKAIIKEPAFQMRKKLDENHVQVLQRAFQAGVPLPPVSLAEIDGRLYVIDGFHRLEAAGIHATVAATVEKMNRFEALERAAAANLKNALPLKPSERKKAERTMLEAYIKNRKHTRIGRRGTLEGKPYRLISEELYGGEPTHETVRKWLQRHHKAVWQRWWGGQEDLPEDTGTTTIEPLTADEEAFEEFVTLVARMYEASQRMTNPATRGEAIQALRKTLEDVEKSAPYEEPLF